MSKVSVVVPIYNPGKKLHKCIKSILEQTFTEFELILVNDGSTDGSLEICNKYRSEDKRVIVINKKNEGSIATRRVGVQAANFEYVMFVDADDWVDKTALKILYEEAQKNDADITVCSLFKVLGSQKLIKSKYKSDYFLNDRVYQGEDIKNSLVVAYFHGHPFPSSLCAKLYKKEILLKSGNLLGSIKFLGEDLFYNLEVFLKARRVKLIDNPLYFYRVGGLTSNYMPFLFDDMVNGYKIQKNVINEYFIESLQKQFNGISITLLNTFKTCLINLFYSNFSVEDKMKILREYVDNVTLQETLSNSSVRNYFSAEYLEAIQNKDIRYLYSLGEFLYKKTLPKRIILKALSKVI